MADETRVPQHGAMDLLLPALWRRLEAALDLSGATAPDFKGIAELCREAAQLAAAAAIIGRDAAVGQG